MAKIALTARNTHFQKIRLAFLTISTMLKAVVPLLIEKYEPLMNLEVAEFGKKR